MNPFTMMKDAKNMEKMMKPALEKFMKDAGFVKKEELEPLIRRIAELENQAASLSIDVAEKILGQELSAENKQTAMIGKIIEDVKFN